MFAGVGLQVLIGLIIFAVGSGTGWTVNQWRNGAQIEKLSSENSVLVASNEHCATDVQSVRQSVASIEQAADERVKAAQAEAVKAQPKADKHIAAAKTIKAAPIRPDETQCQAVEREQVEYVQGRANGN